MSPATIRRSDAIDDAHAVHLCRHRDAAAGQGLSQHSDRQPEPRICHACMRKRSSIRFRRPVSENQRLAPIGAISISNRTKRQSCLRARRRRHFFVEWCALLANRNGVQLRRPGDLYAFPKRRPHRGLADHHHFAWTYFAPYVMWEEIKRPGSVMGDKMRAPAKESFGSLIKVSSPERKSRSCSRIARNAARLAQHHRQRAFRFRRNESLSLTIAGQQAFDPVDPALPSHRHTSRSTKPRDRNENCPCRRNRNRKYPPGVPRRRTGHCRETGRHESRRRADAISSWRYSRRPASINSRSSVAEFGFEHVAHRQHPVGAARIGRRPTIILVPAM